MRERENNIEGIEIELIRISAQQGSGHFHIARNVAGSSDLCVFCSAPVLLKLNLGRKVWPKLFFSLPIPFLRLHKVKQLCEFEI